MSANHHALVEQQLKAIASEKLDAKAIKVRIFSHLVVLLVLCISRLVYVCFLLCSFLIFLFFSLFFFKAVADVISGANKGPVFKQRSRMFPFLFQLFLFLFFFFFFFSPSYLSLVAEHFSSQNVCCVSSVSECEGFASQRGVDLRLFGGSRSVG